jgi:fucose permease
VAAVFFVVGLVLSAWFTQIPQFKAALSLSDGQLGLALLCPAAGALLSMLVAGRIARRYGSAALMRAAPLGMAGAIMLVGASHGFRDFMGALLVFGAADGLTGVSMNAHAVAVETALGRPILQRMHASFSLGTIVGALTGGAAIWAHVSPLRYLAAIAVAAATVSLAAGARLLPATADQIPAAASRAPGRARRGAGWSRFVIVLGLLGAGCLLAETAAESWGAVFLRDQRHAAPALASAGYFVFAGTQLAGRLSGDRLHLRLGSVRLVRSGAAVAAMGLIIELLPVPVPVSIAGIAVYSLGLSVLVPIIFGAVGHGSATEHGSASVTGAVAKFTTLSYSGSLLGPVWIGWLAQAMGLTWSLASVLVILGAIGWFAGWTSRALPHRIAVTGTLAG